MKEGLGVEYYQEFIRRHKLEYNPSVEKAFALAEKAHEGQFRHSGEPFFTHPLAVADIVADLGLDDVTIIATILHDAVEDTALTTEDIGKEFTPEIAKLV
ncbi:MAG: HD domain-containing protein, partial [Christensenella sp.]